MADDQDRGTLDRLSASLSGLLGEVRAVRRQLAPIADGLKQAVEQLHAMATGFSPARVAAATPLDGAPALPAPAASPPLKLRLGSVEVPLARPVDLGIDLKLLKDVTYNLGAVTFNLNRLPDLFAGAVAQIRPELKDVVGRVRDLVTDVRLQVKGVIANAKQTIDGVVADLTQRGVLPISNLTSILDSFLDRVVARYRDVIHDAGTFLTLTGRYLANTLNELGRFLGKILDFAIDKLMSRVDGLIEKIVAPIRWAAGIIIGGAFFVADVFREVGKYLTTTLINAGLEMIARIQEGLGETLQRLPDVGGSHAAGRALSAGAEALRARKRPEVELGKALSEDLERDLQRGRAVSERWIPKRTGAEPTPPRFRAHAFPDFPGRDRSLDVPSFELVPAAGTTVTPPRAAAGAPPAAPTAITLNGGIQIQVSAERFDFDSAPAVARMVADKLLDEMRRLAEEEKFRRGLPTGALR